MKPFKFEIDEESDAGIKDFGCKMKSIIDLYYEDAAAKLDGEILSAVHKVGIHVDKDRLLKALTDTRAFYDEGFADGQAAQQKWIPVAERLPEKSGWYLVVTDFGDCRGCSVLAYSYRHKAFNAFDGLEDCVNAIPCTHWMPAPELPKEGE